MDEESIERARMKLGEVVDRARLADQFTMITRQGKRAAVVVSVEWYEDVLALLADHEAYEAWRERATALRRARRAAGLKPQDPRVVHHIDGNPANNDLDNLRLVDPKDNGANGERE